MTGAVEEYDRWRHELLRDGLAQLTQRYEEQGSKRMREELAGPSLLPLAPANRELSDDDALQLFEAIELKDSANAEYRRGMYESAIRLYTQALDGLPNALRSTHAEVAIILSNRAAAYNQLQDFRKVIADTTAALAIDPVNIKALMRRGFAYEAMERYPAALKDMETIGRLAPRTTEAVRAAGRLRGLIKAWNAIQAQEEEERDSDARPPSLDSWESSASDAPSQPTAGAQSRWSRQNDDGMQFNSLHADMASVVHYDYSAVLYLTSSDTATAATRGNADTTGFAGGNLVFCDGDVDHIVVPRGGRLVGFSSGLENAHRIEAVVGDDPSPRVVLTMWFTTSAAYKEDPGDRGFHRSGGSKRNRSRM